MKKILLLSSLLFSYVSFAQIIEVKQDSTGDFAIIQEAINASADGDTVLVWPGTYFENVDFVGKNITLASLCLTTAEESYKYSTIIDGNQTGSCIKVWNNESNILIFGLTLINGTGDSVPNTYWLSGGGVLFSNVTATISNCIIKNNAACPGYGGGIEIWGSDISILNCRIFDNRSRDSGGGISCNWFSNLYISNTSIHNNHAQSYGGGIFMGHEAAMTMDTVEKCNVFMNYAMRGADFTKGESNDFFKFVVDTFTVSKNTPYFISSYDIMGWETHDVVLDAMHAKIKPYDGDLFVDPVNGSDDNDGTSPQSPLQTIASAYTKIAVDSLENNSIQLANGTYSDTANNEKFPLNIRPFIDIVGESMEGVVFDGRNKVMMFRGHNRTYNYSFRNITLIRGEMGIYDDWRSDNNPFGVLYLENENVSLDNMTFDDALCGQGSRSLLIRGSNNTRVTNCTFKNIVGERALKINNSNFEDTARINNCIFMDNKPDENHPENKKMGGGLMVGGGQSVCIINNSLFVNNDTDGFSSSLGQTFVSNCTFVDNAKEVNNTSAFYCRGSDLSMYNSIFYNNDPSPIWVSTLESTVSELYVYSSLLENGIESIILNGESYLYYDSTNIDADPKFLGMWGHPYMIADGSPCIDAGTLNLPDFIELPEFDLAGNPRIVGDSIDMGAYEWNPTIVGFNEIGPGNGEKKPKLLKASPNPFDWGTYVEVDPEYSGEVEVKVEVYDNHGNLVRNILSTTLNKKQEILWYGNDNNGNPLPVGIYTVVMFSGEKEVESLKVIKK